MYTVKSFYVLMQGWILFFSITACFTVTSTEGWKHTCSKWWACSLRNVLIIQSNSDQALSKDGNVFMIQFLCKGKRLYIGSECPNGSVKSYALHLKPCMQFEITNLLKHSWSWQLKHKNVLINLCVPAILLVQSQPGDQNKEMQLEVLKQIWCFFGIIGIWLGKVQIKFTSCMMCLTLHGDLNS